jgi:gas vesicle protein
MVNENLGRVTHKNNILGVVIALLVGSLVGAVTMLLLAPQSGKDTRTQIQSKGIELRDRTSGMVEDAISSLRQVKEKITMGGHQEDEELFQPG